MKIFLAVVFSLVFAATAFTQDLPNVDKFEVVGTTRDETTTFLVSDVRRQLPRIEFQFLMVQSQRVEDGLAFNPGQWVLFQMKADCSDMSYQTMAERGVNEGKPYVGKKGKKQKPDPRSNIGQVLIELCNEQPRLPVLEADDNQ